VAVLLVILDHVGIRVNGGIGVTIFFVLSGFLITWLLLKEEAKWGSISLRFFYLRRALRIFPAFYVFWFLVFIVLGVMRHRPVEWGQAITSFFYVSDYYQATTGNWNGPAFHAWSLSIEEQFYLLWPLSFMLLQKNESRLRVLLFLVPSIWMYRLVLIIAGVSQNYIYSALDTRADQLLIGCALALTLFLGRGTRTWTAVTSSAWAWLPTLSLFVLSIAAFNRYSAAYRDTIGFIVDGLLSAVLLVQGLAFSPAWLNWPPIRYVGRISYSIYLYHMLGAPFGLSLARRFPEPVRVASAIAASIALGSFSYWVIEQPFLRLKERKAGGH
jgi:peptidoglycan/LPS O-acetylase OafA/YrhL